MQAPGTGSCSVVWVEELWESVDQGYTDFFCSAAFLVRICFQLCRAPQASSLCLSVKELLSSFLIFQPCDKAPTAFEPLKQGKGNESSVRLQSEELMRSYQTWRGREISWSGTKLNAFTLQCSINAK